MAKAKKKKAKGKSTRKQKPAVWGRPRSYDKAPEFDRECQRYFQKLSWNAPNIAGICVFLGISRDTWERYRKQKGEFCGTITNVEFLIESWWVNRLKYPGAGAIFYLKNFRPKEYKDRISGDPDAPLTMQITGMRIVKEKK